MGDTVGGQIISELGQLGKKVGGEVAKVPKDIAGKALESLGSSSGKKQTGQASTTPQVTPGEKPKTAWEQIDVEQNEKVKRQIARRALEELMKGDLKRPKEPSIWERLQMEADQKKKESAAQSAAAAQQISMPSSKRARGDLYGTKAKQTATENRNVRQD